MTYDNTEYIRNLADRFGFQTRRIAMKSSHHARMTELLIGRNLDWVQAAENARKPASEVQAFLEFEPQTAPY